MGNKLRNFVVVLVILIPSLYFLSKYLTTDIEGLWQKFVIIFGLIFFAFLNLAPLIIIVILIIVFSGMKKSKQNINFKKKN